ncbi:hypothetical protein E2C01_102517 [Portunus trituberculatus]|uniref:Uncharacterized protein n=1 Tax=Portunus trituberculatus TaxID=210409 RepID=A0A5B7KIJ5_PORTR|nr:hypothetical protein [Portunus trituberculatus]
MSRRGWPRLASPRLASRSDEGRGKALIMERLVSMQGMSNTVSLASWQHLRGGSANTTHLLQGWAMLHQTPCASSPRL